MDPHLTESMIQHNSNRQLGTRTRKERFAMGKGVIVLTYACNLRCTYCYAGAEVFSKPKTMSFEEALRSVDFLKMIGISTYTLLGGEPTIFPRLVEIVNYSADMGLSPWVVTNGVRF